MATQQRLKRLLIVEDNIDLIHLLGLALELQGYEIIRATDGQQAINMASIYLPDLILLDMSLPDMDGLEVARLIRQNQMNQSIQILAMTGRGFFRDKEELIKNSYGGFISKPFTIDQLCSHIEMLLK